MLQALVDGAHGVGVDVQSGGEVAQTRQALAGRERAVAQTRAQGPGELHTDGHLGVAVEDEIEIELIEIGGRHAATQSSPIVRRLTVC